MLRRLREDVRTLGRALQLDSIKLFFLELNGTRQTNLDRAQDVSSNRRAVQVGSIKPRAESSYRSGFSA